MAATQKHSSKTSSHNTSAPVVKASIRTMGGPILLDPATSHAANRMVRAKRIYTRANGKRTFLEPWKAKRVFLNPPGGQTPIMPEISRSNPAAFWHKLVSEWLIGNVKQAVFIGFSLEIMQTSQLLDVPSVLEFPRCITKVRPRYDVFRGGVRKSGAQPPHASVYVYLPERGGTAGLRARWFEEEFSQFGKVVLCECPRRA